MTIKEYLNSYKRIVIRIRVLERDIQKLAAEIGGGALRMDGMPHGSNLSDSTGQIAVQLADMKARRMDMLLEAYEKRDEIEDVILAVSDPIYLQLLHDRYIRLMNWNDITDDLHLYNDQYVRGKLHQKALFAAEEIWRIE